ncbi:MAG: PIN domain-containing protein [Gemmatimonadetes bacterium]|nr:PIN domain-containing protein [Gemmatimonadota bacterium]
MRYILDTDTCSYVMKRSSQAVLRNLGRVAVADVCMSVITKAELLYGVEVSPRAEQDGGALKSLLSYVEVLEFPEEAASHYAEIRGALKMPGEMIGANDLLIAAHASRTATRRWRPQASAQRYRGARSTCGPSTVRSSSRTGPTTTSTT